MWDLRKYQTAQDLETEFTIQRHFRLLFNPIGPNREVFMYLIPRKKREQRLTLIHQGPVVKLLLQ